MIAVTGANGLLGSFIVRKLIDKNEKFVALKRSGSDTSLLQDVADRIQWRDADVQDEISLRESFEGVTKVIHSAGMVSYNARQAERVVDVNVQGTRNVVNACLANDVKRLMHVSSVAALGRVKGQQLIAEDNKWVDGSGHSVYAESKYQAELEVFRGQEEGLSTIMVNPSVILAPADWSKSSARLFRYVWKQSPFYTDGFMNYVDVRDVAEAVHQLLHGGEVGERFILNAGNISFKDFFDKIANRFNRKAPSIKLSKTMLTALANVENIRTYFTDSEPLITRETSRWAGTSFLYDNQKISKKLSFRFQPIDETVQWCCEYYIKKEQAKKSV